MNVSLNCEKHTRLLNTLNRSQKLVSHYPDTAGYNEIFIVSSGIRTRMIASSDLLRSICSTARMKLLQFERTQRSVNGPLPIEL